jgi:hypothetical protein
MLLEARQDLPSIRPGGIEDYHRRGVVIVYTSHAQVKGVHNLRVVMVLADPRMSGGINPPEVCAEISGRIDGSGPTKPTPYRVRTQEAAWRKLP